SMVGLPCNEERNGQAPSSNNRADSRDFLSMLPLTLTLKEFNGREKIGDLPRKLEYSGSPGSDPEDSGLIYFAPWGNLARFYRDFRYSRGLIRLAGSRAASSASPVTVQSKYGSSAP